MKRLAALFVSLALGAALSAQQPQQPQQPFGERIDVNVVLLDAIVTDAKGNQILGLGPSDFIVKENGVAQQVESVDYFTNRRLLNEREENAPFNVERVREERYFIFFFDKPTDPGALFDATARARDAVRDFVRNQMKENDRVAIVGHDTRLKVYSDFTNDRKQLERALKDAAAFGTGIDRPTSSASILGGIDAGAMRNQTGTVYEALDVLAHSLRGIRARKNLVLFSPGIMGADEDARGGVIVNRSRFVDPMLQSLNAANVSVYAVQLQQDADATPLFHQRLTELANETGGRYFQFNTSFKPAIERIENVSNGYYLLSYRSQHSRGERGFQKVTVSVKDPSLRVTSRAGYAYGD
ncbi:MAG TPA: VWA domain-containing protein [Thermoanaerobaculia bacterium]|jgi:VWFA-related protein